MFSSSDPGRPTSSLQQNTRSPLFIGIPVVLFLAIVFYQLLGPTPIGLANNNDFPRVLGALRLWPIDSVPPGTNLHSLFHYFVPEYVVSNPAYHSGVPSSESLIAHAAKDAAAVLLPRRRFDLRLMGVIHALLLALALFLCLWAIRREAPWVRICSAIVLILIWTDLEYVQQFSTAYTDAGAVVALGLVFSIAVNSLLVSGRWPWAVAFALSGGFLIATKTQHLTALPFLVAFSLFAGFRQSRSLDRRAWLALPVLLVGIAGWMIAETPENYRVPPAFTVVFFKLAPLSPDPKSVLADFRMPEGEFLKYVGHYWYEPGVPKDPAFERRILSLVTPSTLAAFYLHRPGMLAKVLLFDLRGSAPDIALSSGYGHLREMDIRLRKHPFELTVWSGFRKRLFALAPDHLIWLFAFAILCSAFCLLNPITRRRLRISPLVLFSVLLAISSFLFASLLDGTETSRHLVFFQAATDLAVFSIVLAALLMAANLLRLRERNSRPHTMLPVLVRWAVPAVFVLLLLYSVFPRSHPRRLTGTFDDTSGDIEYNGIWKHGAFTAAANGTMCYSNDAAARARLEFKGTRITWVYAKAWNRGVVSVRIDGMPRGEFDLYSPKIVWQSRTTFAGLPPGDHTFEVKLTGRKNPAASDEYMDIDALVVH